ncbi:MAG: DNA repair protein RadC [Myxococcales bacterium]|nr:DNA repair protein RadC [Myxococcales bacterium]
MEPEPVPPARTPADPTRACTADGPRERLARNGPAALSDAELVALLLRTGSRANDALSTARALLDGSGGLHALAVHTARELGRHPGVGPAKAASLVAALELGRRIATRRLDPGTGIRGPADVFRHFHARLRHATQERFVSLLLDGRHRVIEECEISRGTLTASLVHPREVFRPALRAGAAALVVVHNHPSGDPTPSQEDRRVTERLRNAGELLGVPLLDHVVVAEHGYRSLKEEGDPPGLG